MPQCQKMSSLKTEQRSQKIKQNARSTKLQEKTYNQLLVNMNRKQQNSKSQNLKRKKIQTINRKHD